jgi:DNA-directed RNA polymerase subunit L
MENANIHNFFPLDPYTNYPIIINKLKSNVSNEDDGEELDITCIPKIGQGRQHARHDPTGTVTYSFEIDNDKEVDRRFRQKLEYINAERKLKGLSEYSNEEVDELRRSFNLLDRERVYIQVDDNPIVNFSVETIGFKTPDHIIIDGITMLTLTIKDILHSIKITVDDVDIVRVKTNPKVIISEAPGKNTGYIVKAVGENHTIGNLVNYYLRKQVIDSKEPICSYAGYRMDHPLIEEVEWLYTLDNDVEETVDKLLPSFFNKNYFSELTMDEQALYKCLSNQTYLAKREYIYTCIIIDAFRAALDNVVEIKKELVNKIGLRDPSFVLDDPAGYL